MESRTVRGTIAFDAMPAASALEWASRSQTLAAISVYNDRALTLSTLEGPFRLAGIAATPSLFDLLGVAPQLGCAFEPDTTDTRQVVLSHRTWRQFFGGAVSVVGTSIRLDGESYQVIGVMPASFTFPTDEAAFWVPMLIDAGGTRGMMLPAVARLRSGATMPAMLEEGRQLFAASVGSREQLTLLARTLQDRLVGSSRRVLWILMAAVGLVSIIGTANIALLLLVRGASRRREFSIRIAIGADRRQLLRQLFAESAVLAAIGGAAGIALAAGLLRVLLRLAPADMPRLQGAALDGPVLAFAVVLATLSSLVFAALSAGRSLTIDPARLLGAPGAESRVIAERSPRRRLNGLAAAELALTLVLLAGAGLLMRSLIELMTLDYGFAPSEAVALQISLPPARYPTPESRLAFDLRVLERVRVLPEVRVAGFAIQMPNRQPEGRFAYDPDGQPDVSDPMTLKVAEVRTVSDGFFEAMGMRVLAGRTFRPEDREGAEPVMVISDRLARLHFPGGDAVGRLLYSGSGTRRVVGVVGNVLPAAAPGTEDGPSAYLPFRQDTGSYRWFAGVTLVVRGGEPDALAASLRALILSLDPDMPPFNVRTLGAEIGRLTAGPRFSASVLAAFALVALALAAVGVYGVMAWSAAERTREIGVRVALGATRPQVLWLVLRDGVVVLSIGLAVGLPAAIALSRTLTGLLYEVQPADPIALATVAAILSSVGLFAALLPARRAMHLDAIDVLRHE
jgi:putative ABC transport system permease protein